MSYSLEPDIPEEEKRDKRALKNALGMFLLGVGILRGTATNLRSHYCNPLSFSYQYKNKFDALCFLILFHII